MISEQFDINLKKLCASPANGADVSQKLLADLDNLQITASEEFFLTRVFPPNPAALAETLELYDRYLHVMRREVPGLDPIKTTAEFESVKWSSEVLQKGEFANRLLCTVYSWYENNDTESPKSFIKAVRAFTGESFSFSSLVPGEWPLFYNALTLFVVVWWLDVYDKQAEDYFFISDMLPLAVRLGYDVEAAVSRTLLNFLSISVRNELSVEFATALNQNPTTIGSSQRIIDWISHLRAMDPKFSEEKQKLFFAQNTQATRLDPGARAVLNEIFSLYRKLLNQDLVLGDVDRNKLEKNIAQLRTQQLVDPSTPTMTLATVLSMPTLDAGVQQKLHRWMAAQKDEYLTRLLISDAVEGKKWRSSPIIENLFLLNDIFVERFKVPNKPFIYYDEEAQSFLWDV